MLTFFWHDYETWGADVERDRACQFAGVRTDQDLNEVGDPLVLYCRPAPDMLPAPGACLVTGITPQRAERQGLIESEFAHQIHRELSRPGTCGAGYNSIRFDDEITRRLFYRNLIDPYAREWRDGNSRWDLIDALRLAHALRPQGLTWPVREDGHTSFRLEDLTGANAIAHGQAHEALADVRATIALARLLRRAQPKLFDYTLSLRDKRRVQELLRPRVPLLHVSVRYAAELGCIAPILPLCPHPTNANGVITFDLRQSPELLADLSVEALRVRLFTPVSALAPGLERVVLKTVHVNRAPVLAPMSTLSGEAAERWSIDPERVRVHARQCAELGDTLTEKLRALFQPPPRPAVSDPDLMIYSGGFLADADRRALDLIRQRSPAELADQVQNFQDPRLPEMLFRYRARNWPETLTPEEREDWDLYRLARLTDPEAGGSIQIDAYQQELAALMARHADDPHKLDILRELEDWGERVLDAEM